MKALRQLTGTDWEVRKSYGECLQLVGYWELYWGLFFVTRPPWKPPHLGKGDCGRLPGVMAVRFSFFAPVLVGLIFLNIYI